MMVHKLIGMLATFMLLGTSSILSAQERQTTYRNGQRYTEYAFPLKGDVEQIEIFDFFINPDDGKEYPRDTTHIRFNINGDVTYIYPYVDTRYTDIVFATELRFMYNNLGYNTLMREITDTGFADIVYDTHYTYNDDWQKIKAEKYNEDGKIIYTEEFIYDENGNLSCEKHSKGESLEFVYYYDDNMNIIETEEYTITEYPNARLFYKTYMNYDEDGRILKETAYRITPKNESRLDYTIVFSYDENGLPSSKEKRAPIDELFIKHGFTSKTEQVDRATFKCDSHGNVIEKTVHPDGAERPKWKTVYRIKYR